VAAVRAEILDELLIGSGVASGRNEDRGAPVDVGEHGDVVLAATKARLVDSEAPDRREILAGTRRVDVVMHDPPQPRVVLADQTGDRVDRHLLGERHHERLEQQRELRLWPRPRHRHEMGFRPQLCVRQR
jgi:hypothetical protein